jgi:hypothetical protein
VIDYDTDIKIVPRDPVHALRRRLLALLEAATRDGLDGRTVREELLICALIVQVAIDSVDAQEGGDQ